MLRAFLTCCLAFCNTVSNGQGKYRDDFNEYWNLINKNFAYFDVQKTDWQKAKSLYQPIADTVATREDFISFLERVNHELYNGHISLNTNLGSSNRLIPSGSDLWVRYQNKKFIVQSVRQAHASDLAGVKAGMQILGYNDLNIDSAVSHFLPRSVKEYDNRMYDYAVNTLLAGTHDTKRSFTVLSNGKVQTFYPDARRTNANKQTLIDSKVMLDGIGYIKINNSLGNSDLIHVFDSVLDALHTTKGLVIDLRETPAGGNTTVARAIMGRFINKTLPYQLHQIPAEEKLYGVRRSWVELVTPRQKIYKKPVIILVNRWTGSMGEGIAIGFDAMKRAEIVGDLMAGLLGANYSYTLTVSKIGFSFPAEKLYHINGTPRENFRPAHLVTDPEAQLNKAIQLLRMKFRVATTMDRN